MRAIQERRYAAARELAQGYLDSHPGDAQAVFLLGQTYYWTGNHGAARPWLERARELEPDNPFVHDFLGYSAFLLGDLDAARREYAALRAADPREPKACYGLGLIELEEARLDEAAASFRRAIELFDELSRRDPGQGAARLAELAECHARLGEVHFARGDYEAARAELVLATAIFPANISAFYTLSLVHRRLGEVELAERAAARHEAAREALVAGQEGRRE